MSWPGGETFLEAATFVFFMLFFDFLERRRPGHDVDRRQDLPLNLLSLAIVVAAGEGWKGLILHVYKALNLSLIFSLDFMRMLPGLAKIFLAVVLADLSLYWVHRGMHGRGMLWRAHIFHHSIAHLWWLSGSRTSLLHLFFFALPQVFIAYVLLQMDARQAAAAFSFGIVVNLWIHTNIRAGLGPLGLLIITPDYHRVHHGGRGLMHTNLGFVFTVWDRLFGTFTDPRSVEKDMALGSVPTRNRLLRMLAGL